MDKFGSFVAGILIGGAAGAITALMLTPQNGEENRKLVADYASNIANNAQEFSNNAYTTIQGGIKTATDKGGEILENVKAAGVKAGEQFGEKNDELRSKIEAARERIAEQVKKNAEESTDSIEIENA